MPAIRASNVRRLLSLGAILVLLSTTVVSAVDPEPVPKKPEPAAKPAEKLIAFEMRDKPWKTVIEWFSDQSGLPFISNYQPTGTFTYIAPKGGNRQLTLAQIIDVLNEALLGQKYILIRRTASFTLVPADEKIDPAVLPRLKLDELESRGHSELASIVLPLASLVAEDLAPEIKKMLGPFGEVVAMPTANQLVIQDTAGNLKRVVQTIKDIEDSEKDKAESFSHTCKYIKARDAERVLKELLGDPREMIRATQSGRERDSGGSGFPFGGGGFPFGGGGSSRDRGSSDRQPQSSAKVRMHYISCDERSNTVLVTGPANKIAQAREIMRKLDLPQPGQQPVIAGAPLLKTYQVQAGTAEAVARTLQDIYKHSNIIRISAIGGSSIMVWAGPDDQFEIARHILGSSDRNSTTELLPLQNLEAAKVADTLKGMFGDTKSGAPYIEADTNRNAIIVKGSADQVGEVKAALKAIGEGGGPPTNMRIITLNQGSAATLAEALQRMMQQMRANPVKVIVPGGEAPKTEPEKLPAKPKDGSSLLPGRQPQPDDPNADLLASADGPQLEDPRKEKPKDNLPGRADAPVTITAFGNKLIITSEDPAALALVQELVRLLTTTPGGEGDFEVIKLKNANAVEAAKILDEAFNGIKRQDSQQQQGNGGGFGSFFGRMSGGQAPVAPPANPSANRIRVVADPATNTLLVRASPLDMLTIRRLLEKAIDASDSDSKAVMRTWILGPLKYATATEVAVIVKDVYRESINNNPTNSFIAATPFGAFGGRQRNIGGASNVDPNGNPRGVTLSVGVDDRSNSLVINCSEAMYEDVKKLVDQLEAAAKDSTRTVKVISIKGVDPLLVQQAVDAIQGRRTQTPTQGGMMPSMMNSMGGMRGGQSSGFSPFGGSGFSPFGGSGVTPGMQSSPFRPIGGFSPGSFSPGGATPGGGVTPGTGGMGPRGVGTPGGTGGFQPRGAAPPGTRGGGGSGDSRGPDFFAQRVTDDPQQNLLFDPQQPEQVTHVSEAQGLQPLGLEATEESQPQSGVTAEPGIRGPRQPVTAEALEQLGVIVISGNNPADVEEVLRIIEYIRLLGAGAEPQIQLVPLDFADATSVATTLNQMFQQVIVGATGNVRATAQGVPGVGAAGQQGGSASVVMLALPRHNSILLAAPRVRMDDIVREIKRLDRPNSPQGQMTAFPLKKASAARVATLVQQFYAQRYPNETTAQNQVRITEDDSTNTVFVQAAPADLAEIRSLIERIDNTVSNAVNDLRIVPLRNALSDDLANLLLQAIAQGVATPSSAAAPGIIPGAGVGGVGAAGALGGLGLRPGGLGGLPGVGQAGTAAGVSGQAGAATKNISLRFFGSIPDVKGVVESGLLDDIRITSDPRTNSLIIAAPGRTMDLLLSLIRELDVPPAARAEVKIFTLKKADAAATAIMLQQLFLGTSGAAGGAGIGGGIPGIGGIGGAGAVTPTGATFGGAAGLPRPLMSLGGPALEGPPLIDLRLSVDQRTNSVIVGGSRNDLDVIEAVISRLEDSAVPERQTDVVKLKNANAADVAAALQNFVTRSLQILSQGQLLTAYQELERDIAIVPEPISNTLLISATPRYFGDILRILHELDAPQPQVVIQVLIAEVDLQNSEEFGVEVGLQSPILFSRSVIPAPNGFGGGTVNYTDSNTAGTAPGLVPAGVTVNSSINPAALPGFNFNSTASLGNNPLAGPGLVGFQGLQNLGVGRSSINTPNVGGFVFSAASDAFTLLIRALKTQNRLDILSRPQIMTLDRQAASILIGQSFPYSTGTNVTGTGILTANVSYRNIGVQLDVTPQISPDGKVIMRVTPQISSAVPGTVPLGNGVNAQIFNVQTVDTTVVAQDGETVAIGGLITKGDNFAENKIPWLGDLPKIGAMFRYRTNLTRKVELLVILTPHIVYCPADADRILAEESKRIDWAIGDVMKIHATTGMEPILSRYTKGPALTAPVEFPPLGTPAPPPSGAPAPPPPDALPPLEILPPPRKLLPGQSPQSRAQPQYRDVTPAVYQIPAPADAGVAPPAPKPPNRTGLLAPFLNAQTDRSAASK